VAFCANLGSGLASGGAALTSTRALGDITVLVSGNGCKGVADEAAQLDGVTKVLE